MADNYDGSSGGVGGSTPLDTGGSDYTGSTTGGDSGNIDSGGATTGTNGGYMPNNDSQKYIPQLPGNTGNPVTNKLPVLDRTQVTGKVPVIKKNPNYNNNISQAQPYQFQTITYAPIMINPVLAGKTDILASKGIVTNKEYNNNTNIEISNDSDSDQQEERQYASKKDSKKNVASQKQSNTDSGICKNNDETSGTRLILYGGASHASDNSAFLYAAKNVQKDYKNGARISPARSGKKVVETVNGSSSIVSLDMLTHGGPAAAYMVWDYKSKQYSSTEYDIPTENVRSNNLYASKTVRFIEQGRNAGPETDVINNFEYSRFTNNAIIEIHGCKAVSDFKQFWLKAADNIAINLSEALYDAGKKCAVVIGHLDKANPNINGSNTTDDQQDYRHGVRIVLHNGKELFRTTVKGKISRDLIKSKLDQKMKK